MSVSSSSQETTRVAVAEKPVITVDGSGSLNAECVTSFSWCSRLCVDELVQEMYDLRA